MNTPARGTLINPMARHLEAIGGPIRIAHAEGVYLYDDTGRSWIDCETGSGVFSLGHRNPELRPYFDGSIRELDLGNHHLISEPRGDLAFFVRSQINFAATESSFEDIYRNLGLGKNCPPPDFPDSPSVLVYNVSSSECVDSAIKLARGAKKKDVIVSAENAYHGSTGYALAASARCASQNCPAQPPGFMRVPFGAADAIADTLRQHKEVAAILLEPIAVEAGCKVLPDDYLQRVATLCEEHDVLLILDESITGLGRTGSPWSWIPMCVIPDILIVGRALGGGFYPLYATCHRRALDEFYVRNPFVHVSTFGGGEVGCQVAEESLCHLTDDDLLSNVTARGDQFRSGVASARGTFSSVDSEVRGSGLLNAVEFCDADTAKQLQHELFTRGVFCRAPLLAPETLLFIPPLTITAEEIDVVLSALSNSLNALTGRLP